MPYDLNGVLAFVDAAEAEWGNADLVVHDRTHNRLHSVERVGLHRDASGRKVVVFYSSECPISQPRSSRDEDA